MLTRENVAQQAWIGDQRAEVNALLTEVERLRQLADFVKTFDSSNYRHQHDTSRGVGNGFCAHCAVRDLMNYAYGQTA